jgi:DNA polymerase-3 subunit epsilon
MHSMTSTRTDTPARSRQRQLPTFYYHKHFLEMLDFVCTHYAHVLSDEERAVIGEFRRLDRMAQCLYVRLVNRKGRVFAVSRLRYPEIGDLGTAVEALRAGGWAGAPSPAHFPEVLDLMTRGDILEALAPVFVGMSKSLNKEEVVGFALEHCEPRDFLGRIDADRLLVQRRDKFVRFLLFLYFGEAREGLSRFTMRDMGLVQPLSFSDSFEPRFQDRDEARTAFFFAAELMAFRRVSGIRREAIVAGIDDWPEPEGEGAIAFRDLLALGIGRSLENSGRLQEAIRVLALAESSQGRERHIRLLYRTGEKAAAKAALEVCLDNPGSDEEWLFASDFYTRKFDRKRTSVLTDTLRSAEIVDLDESLSGAPEQAAIGYYQRLGHEAYRAENTLWRSLFGLLFWDELFAADATTVHSPFDSLPACLKDRSFHVLNAEAIESRLDGLRDVDYAMRRMLRTCAAHFGTPNGVFRWRPDMAESLVALLAGSPPAALATVLRRMSRDYINSRYGYPDLLVIDDVGVRFVEVKSDGDQLRRNQMSRLRQLREAGFRADVIRVRWVLDPTQVYVVVDVETTGGTAAAHRLTELAALKVRDGEVVDRFHTLLNPQRPIPPRITRLTGICDPMVAGAPLFADVAGDFERFMDGAIFVAHNVNFDYGFIEREYARIGREFRYPKLCTCVAMRKHYPGHDSYSLAALCRQYDIPLKQHHRAMCDAEAAAELLLLVNERRAASLSAD